MPDQTCADRIGEHLQSRIADFNDLLRLGSAYGDEMTDDLREAAERVEIDASDSTEDLAESAQDKRFEMPLSVESKTIYEIVLSTGGPHDEFQVTVNSDNEVESVEYVFMDWFDGARKTLSGDDERTALEFLSAFLPDEVTWS